MKIQIGRLAAALAIGLALTSAGTAAGTPPPKTPPPVSAPAVVKTSIPVPSSNGTSTPAATPQVNALTTTGTGPTYPTTANGTVSWGNWNPLNSRGVMDGPKTKIYLVLWGNQWGTQTVDANGIKHYSGDRYDGAGMAQRFLNAIGNGESWSATLSEYCDPPSLSYGVTTCPYGGTPYSQTIPYQAGGVLAGVYYDNAAAAPLTPSSGDVGNEATVAANALGYTTSASNANNLYVVMTPTGVNPDSDNPQNGSAPAHCGSHGFTNSGTDNLSFIILPYVMDMSAENDPATGLPYCDTYMVNGRTNGILDGYSIILGHEWAEAMTEPIGSFGWHNVNPNSGLTNQEIADECYPQTESPNNGLYFQNVSFGAAGTFVEQALWSNHSGTCVYTNPIAINPATPTIVAPAGVVSGTAYQFAATGTDATLGSGGAGGTAWYVDGGSGQSGWASNIGTGGITIDTTKLSNGTHTIATAEQNAYGAVGNHSATVTFTVTN